MTKKDKTCTVIVMCSNIYDEQGVKHVKSDRFECEKTWADEVRKGDKSAGRDYRIEVI